MSKQSENALKLPSVGGSRLEVETVLISKPRNRKERRAKDKAIKRGVAVYLQPNPQPEEPTEA